MSSGNVEPVHCLIGVPFVRCNGVCPGGPNVPLTQPNNTKVKHIAGDGNCLFWLFSYIITGSEEHHLNHMVHIAHLLLGAHVPSQYTSIQQYIAATRMNHSTSWGTDVEIYTLSHLLHTSVFTYDMAVKKWKYSLGTHENASNVEKAMYIRHPRTHFDVVCDVYGCSICS